MSIKSIIIFFMVAGLIFVSVNYAKVELQTSIRLDEFENVVVPEDLNGYKYLKVWQTDRTDATVLFAFENGDKYFVDYFRESKITDDPTDISEFGDWQYLDHTKIEGFFFPPYI